MSKKLKELAQLVARITGEMEVKDIAVSSAVDIEALKKGDDDPLEVVVEIPVSQSKRGWYYTHEALKDIVDAVNERTLHGFLGHQKPEDVPNEFPDPVTHWVGAKMTEDAAYFRGVVDASAVKLKRWIRGNVVKQVSVFGEAHLAESNGSTHVVGYDPLSIDWTPLDRMGMPTRIVAVGEMHGVNVDEDKGGIEVKPEEVLVQIKKMYGTKQITPKMIVDALGVSAVQLAGEMDDSFKKQHAQMDGVLKELNVSGEMDAIQVVKDLKAKAKKYEQVQSKRIIGEMIGKKINNESAVKNFLDEKTPLGKLWAVHCQQFKGDEKVLSAEMDKFLEDVAVKTLLSGYESTGSTVLTGEMKDDKQQNQIKNARVTRASF
ncbi:hypothetical protein FC756_00810 [Lysinibacillus mangiferihumi]|uniref:Uncharacterized protein n=1 Tax=Lysinibacillus mangiferihumi TaxID=1130819 RepID=A0A4U2ZD46_9BACI|nr:hypothetical protein [Lysinibacillus mangiferihumi]TKI72636.1 hypothetical protein FC756_00810 [Lysinibacillus mangiferihumi]